MKKTFQKKDGRKFKIKTYQTRRNGWRVVRQSERKDGTWTDWYILPDKVEYEFPHAVVIEESY